MTSALFLVIIYGVYGLAIFGAITALRKTRVPANITVIISFMLLGIVAGLVAVSMWPDDLGAVFNIPANLLGDKLYQWSIILFGDPSSSQAHFTIPWLLRVPQVYVVSSIISWGIIGFLIQLVYDRFAHSHKAH